MIITCPCKKKKFNIDAALIPTEGRDLQCGACDKVWFYKNNNQPSDTITQNQVGSLNENQTNIIEDESTQIPQINDKDPIRKIKDIDNEITENKIRIKKTIDAKKDEKKSSNKFFSYLVVFIISFVALIILLETFKTPLMNVFPGLEHILFNLFETLKDIKLFIIELS